MALTAQLQKRTRHIIELVGYSERPLRIVTRFYANGPLSVFIHDPERDYDGDWMEQVARGIATGMSFVHAANIVHYDLKPANVLLDADLSPVIADFGVAKVVGSVRTVQGFVKNGPVTGFTPGYGAPELYHSFGIILESDKKADVFSFAMCLFELMTRKPLWTNAEGQKLSHAEIREALLKGERPHVDEFTAEAFPLLLGIVKACWNEHAFERPSFDDILKRLTQ